MSSSSMLGRLLKRNQTAQTANPSQNALLLPHLNVDVWLELAKTSISFVLIAPSATL